MSMLTQLLRDLRPTVRVRTVQGEPVTVGEHQLVPIARTLWISIGRPGGILAAGWARSKPLAVLDTYRGQTRRITIPDVTRRVQWALLAMPMLLLAGARLVSRAREKEALGHRAPLSTAARCEE
ncbi:MAG: hypothetical protein ACUVX9_00535 [Anaerolineae bacterium]